MVTKAVDLYTKPAHALEVHASEPKAGNLVLREGAFIKECEGMVFMLKMLLNLSEINLGVWNSLYGMSKLGYPSCHELILECGAVFGPLLMSLGRFLPGKLMVRYPTYHACYEFRDEISLSTRLTV